MNGKWSHSHAPTLASIYLGMLSSHLQNFIWQVNCMPTLQICYIAQNSLFQIWVVFSYNHSYFPMPCRLINGLSYFSFLFLSNIKKLFYSFPSVLITNSLIFFTEDPRELYFSSLLFLFTVAWEIAMIFNYIKIFVKLKINRHTVNIFQPKRLTS